MHMEVEKRIKLRTPQNMPKESLLE